MNSILDISRVVSRGHWTLGVLGALAVILVSLLMNDTWYEANGMAYDAVIQNLEVIG